MIEPLSLGPLTRIEAGRNDANPAWTPSGTLIAFERSRGDKKGDPHHAARRHGGPDDLFSAVGKRQRDEVLLSSACSRKTSYNAGISWSPAGDRFVFMSNGGEGNYDIYLRELGGKTTTRLTDHKEKDGQAHWSPVNNAIVFVSGRTGKGDLYVMDLLTRALTRLTQGGKAYLYPQWSPDGKKVAMMHGSNENHDIYLIGDLTKPGETLKALTTWNADDLRPVWSPDGKKIAFYSNYNAAGDPKLWSPVVIAADGSDPAGGDGLAARVVAQDIIPDVERGPAWMPDSQRIVYVKNDRQEYNPIYLVDLKAKTNLPIKTGHQDEPRRGLLGGRNNRLSRAGAPVGSDFFLRS